MSKRIGALLLAIMMVLGIAAGCASTTATTAAPASTTQDSASTSAAAPAGEKIKLTYWTPFSGGDGEFMQTMVDKFNSEQTEIQVEMLNVEWAQYYTKLRTSLVSKTGPDVAIAHASKLAELEPTGMLADVDALGSEVGVDWSTYSENALKSTYMSNKHIAIPMDTHALILYYNKDYFEKAGMLDASGKPVFEAGPEGFVNSLKKLKETLPQGVFPFVASTDNVVPFWIWLALYDQIEGGGQYIVDNKAAFNNDKAKTAAQFLADLQDQGLWPENINDATQYDLFKTGKAAIHFGGVWSTGNYEQNQSLNFGAMPLPAIFDKAATWGDSHTLVVPVQDDKAKQIAAVKFSNWLGDNGIMWATAGHIPAKKTVVESDAFKKLQYRPDYAAAVNSVVYYPQSDKLWPANDIMTQNFSLLMNGSLNVADALSKAEKEVNDLLATK